MSLKNIPIQLTSFVGREREIEYIQRLLHSSRQVTLTGAGGSGKTRLAIEVANLLEPFFTHGVWLAELASLRDPALVPQVVAQAFGIRCICMPTHAEALHFGGTRYNSHPEDDFDFVGTPKQIIDQMRAFIEMGVTSFGVDCGGWPRLTTLELLINEVIPALKD
jgi:alkanesulfonate monooxygenase SsuD/methylene tetrahydromethanopterin reductase-like flavin-dependent oxidoreductase (luciferase family)